MRAVFAGDFANGTVYWGNNGLSAGNWSTSGAFDPTTVRMDIAKEALASWDPALRAADKNYTKADDESGDPNAPRDPSGSSTPGCCG